MLVVLDTEFTGLDQAKPDLISLALVGGQNGDFYAELPEFNWTVQCTGWVHLNVVPHLWGDDYVQSKEAIRERLTVWIEAIPEEVQIVSDCPSVDFFAQLKPLLSTWPKNLSPWPVTFNKWSMGDEMLPVLQKRLDEYHTTDRPLHHALHDARALQFCMLYARLAGWHPGYEAKE